MNRNEPGMQEQVWRRVFAQPEPRQESLGPLIMAAQEQTASLRQLAGSLASGREEAARLYQESWNTVLTLVGLERLRGANAEALKPGPQSREPARRLLEKSYRRAKQAVTEYTARSLDGECGMVFQHLARRAETHCVIIAQLLGMLP